MSATRILLVEDEDYTAATAATELSSALTCEIVRIADPVEASARLERENFGAVVADMLYSAHSAQFEERRRRKQVKLTDAQLHLSGLAMLRTARSKEIPAVLWTNGEANRRLHIIFAYEELECRAMCPKDAVGKLASTVMSALQGHTRIDPLLQLYLPPRSAPSLRETFFRSATALAVWRAMALGLHEHSQIAGVVGVEAPTVRKGMAEMRDRLMAFDQGCSPGGRHTPELARYAGLNWQFFLDHTVREMHP
ncbi:hypothetical protein ACFY36_43840 [Actinoplanes sp. NPDC000266]